MNQNNSNDREWILLRRIRWLTWFIIGGLFVSGATAIPLVMEVKLLVRILGADHGSTGWMHWLVLVRDGLIQTHAQYPFLFYGTDWLAFGHFVIAIAFVGALRDAVRNRWLFDFGMIACGLVIPFALVFGGWRGIPAWWRLIDCSFGLVAFIPLWFCRKWSSELEKMIRVKN